MFLADFISEKPFLKIFPLISFEHGTLAAKFYDLWKEVSYSKNKNCFGISEQNGTTCRYVQVKIQKFIKIRITLSMVWTYFRRRDTLAKRRAKWAVRGWQAPGPLSSTLCCWPGAAASCWTSQPPASPAQGAQGGLGGSTSHWRVC